MTAPLWTAQEDAMLRAMWTRGIDARVVARTLNVAFGRGRTPEAAGCRASRKGWQRPPGWVEAQARKGLAAANAKNAQRRAEQATLPPAPPPAPAPEPPSPPRGFLVTEDRATALFARSGRPQPLDHGTTERMGRMPAFRPVDRSLTGSGFHGLVR